MPTIIDVNCASLAFGSPPHDDFKPIISALSSGQINMVVGGTQLKKEYANVRQALSYFLSLERAGRAKFIDDKAVDAETVLVEAQPHKSNDAHIIALARVANARLLCSKDQALHQDFTDPNLINKPRGSVYQDASHAHLIRKLGK